MYKWYSGTLSWVANHSQAFKILLCSWVSLVFVPRCWCPPNLYVRHPLCPTTLWTMPEHLNPPERKTMEHPAVRSLRMRSCIRDCVYAPKKWLHYPFCQIRDTKKAPRIWSKICSTAISYHFKKKSMRVVIPLWKSIKSIEGKPRGPRRSLVVPPESPRHSCPAKVW